MTWLEDLEGLFLFFYKFYVDIKFIKSALYICVILINIIIIIIRGKKQGHDLDILVSHKISGEEKGLLTKILECLSE